MKRVRENDFSAIANKTGMINILKM